MLALASSLSSRSCQPPLRAGLRDPAPARLHDPQADGEEVPADRLQQLLREAVDQTAAPSTVLWVCVSSCLLSAWLAGTAGSWAGKQTAHRSFDRARYMPPSPGFLPPFSCPLACLPGTRCHQILGGGCVLRGCELATVAGLGNPPRLACCCASQLPSLGASRPAPPAACRLRRLPAAARGAQPRCRGLLAGLDCALCAGHRADSEPGAQRLPEEVGVRDAGGLVIAVCWGLEMSGQRALPACLTAHVPCGHVGTSRILSPASAHAHARTHTHTYPPHHPPHHPLQHAAPAGQRPEHLLPQDVPAAHPGQLRRGGLLPVPGVPGQLSVWR